MEQELTSAKTTDASIGLIKEANQPRPRLLAFVKSHVADSDDAEDILQDVFLRLVNAATLVEPIEQLTAWLYRVTRNRIIDWYRGRKHAPISLEAEDPASRGELDGLLADPSQDPASDYLRSLLWDELNEALDELPEEQRDVFVAHELEGKSFKELEQETGVTVNTLLSRKRYAVLYLRERLRELYDEMFEE